MASQEKGKGVVKAGSETNPPRPGPPEHLKRLRTVISEVMARDDSGDEGLEAYCPLPHNRYNKLKRSAPGEEPVGRASAQRMWASHSTDECLEHVTFGRKRAIVKRGALKRQKVERFDVDEDPYADIAFQDILAPPETPEEVLNRPEYQLSLRSNTLEVLAYDAMEMIEKEASMGRLLKRATYLIQMDDPVTRDWKFGASTKSVKSNDVESHSDTAKEEEEAWSEARDALQAAVARSNEIILRLTAAHNRLVRSQSQKVYVRKRLREIVAMRNPQSEGSQSDDAGAPTVPQLKGAVTSAVATGNHHYVDVPINSSGPQLHAAAAAQGGALPVSGATASGDEYRAASAAATKPRQRTSRNSGGAGRLY